MALPKHCLVMLCSALHGKLTTQDGAEEGGLHDFAMHQNQLVFSPLLPPQTTLLRALAGPNFIMFYC
jgi:hypothetical protein